MRIAFCAAREEKWERRQQMALAAGQKTYVEWEYMVAKPMEKSSVCREIFVGHA